ncbi:unnamed protein product, partial [marine sediment metagenome]
GLNSPFASEPLRIGSGYAGALDSVKIYGAPVSHAAVTAHKALLLPTYPLTVSTVMGSYASEVSWLIEDADGVDVALLAPGHGEPSGSTTAPVTYQIENGDFTASLADSYGDGWNGAVLNLTSSNALAVGLTNFTVGNAGSFQFSMASGTLAPIPGATVPDAVEVSPGSHRASVAMTTSVGEISFSITSAGGDVVLPSTSTTVTRDLYFEADGAYTLQIDD